MRKRRSGGALPALLLALLMAAGVACSGADTDPATPDPNPPHVVSYAGAAWRLDALDPLERADQIRDWARIGLAGALGMDRDRILDAFYDTTPVRDAALTDLVQQPTGPGRALFDGQVLHLLVPDGDPNRARTIAELLDQHRVDAGADAATTQVHRYRELPPAPEVALTAEAPLPTMQLRAENGWVESRITDAAALGAFLAGAASLSRLELRPDGLWASGWNRPVDASARVTVTDIAVLQRGYEQRQGLIPAFSLDPGPVRTVDDVRALLPGLRADLAPRVLSGNWAGSGFASAEEVRTLVGDAVFGPEKAAALPARGLPGDRTQLWALQQILEGSSAYRQARYDGGLAGTQVGMTLFYTDYVAKDWTTGVGSGVPDRAVAGFVPDPKAVIPQSLCPPAGTGRESGRLWFGQNDGAFGYAGSAVDVGGRATRLYSRSNGAGGGEVEPSYRFGRGLQWWDRHYELVADYEPQYTRLEQIMRWSGALDWLQVAGFGGPPTALSRLPLAASDSTTRFADWYAAHSELRERARLMSVSPPSAAAAESILHVPSDPAPQCGGLWVQGGVSLAGRLSADGTVPRAAEAVPSPMRRARLDPATSRIDPATRTGQVVDQVTGTGNPADRVVRSIDSGRDRAVATSTGALRAAQPYGEAALRGGTSRGARLELRGDGRNVTFDVDTQQTALGSVTATTVGNRTDLVLRPGVATQLAAFVKRVTERPELGLAGSGALRYYRTQAGTIGLFATGWLELRPALSTRIDAVTVQPVRGAPVEVGPAVPRYLTDADAAAFVPGGDGGDGVVVPFSEVAALVRGAPVYRGQPGTAPIVAAPAPLSPAQRVRLRPARPVAPAGRPVLAGENRRWILDLPAMSGVDAAGKPLSVPPIAVAIPLDVAGAPPPGLPPTAAGPPSGPPPTTTIGPTPGIAPGPPAGGGPVPDTDFGPDAPGLIFLVVACDDSRPDTACAS